MGFSKLGTATWMAATVDTRIEVIAPEAIVYNENFYKDDWPALLQQPGNPDDPYAWIKEWRNTTELRKLGMVVNPLNYMARLEIPKFWAMDTNDLWFDEDLLLIDMWWPALRGPKSMLVTEGTHDTVILKALPSVASYIRGFLVGATAPEIEYHYNETSRAIFVKQTSTGHFPARVTLHSAYTCDNEPQYLFPSSRFRHPGSYPAFRGTEWRIEKDLNETGPSQYPGATHEWLTTLSTSDMPQAFAIAVGACAKAAFVMLEYKGWPEVGAEPFNISTPVFLWQ
jgi:hypothetical protein